MTRNDLKLWVIYLSGVCIGISGSLMIVILKTIKNGI